MTSFFTGSDIKDSNYVWNGIRGLLIDLGHAFNVKTDADGLCLGPREYYGTRGQRAPETLLTNKIGRGKIHIYSSVSKAHSQLYHNQYTFAAADVFSAALLIVTVVVRREKNPSSWLFDEPRVGGGRDLACSHGMSSPNITFMAAPFT